MRQQNRIRMREQLKVFQRIILTIIILVVIMLGVMIFGHMDDEVTGTLQKRGLYIQPRKTRNSFSNRIGGCTLLQLELCCRLRFENCDIGDWYRRWCF